MAILTQPWPPDLDPARVPFRQRTITTLQRMRLWDDMTRIDTVTGDDVAGFWLTGPVTVDDLTNTGNTAISWHHHQANELAATVAGQKWTRQVWRWDRRFTDLLPPVDATVYDIAMTGHHDHQRHLLRTFPALQQRLTQLAAEPPDEALIRYVSVNAGQSRQRTVVLLRRLELLAPAISGSEAGRQLGVSQQRIHQLVIQVRYRIDQIQPPGSDRAWFPQQPEAIEAIATPRQVRARVSRTLST
jgi:hypothetical protein